jgi:hypothetical protein
MQQLDYNNGRTAFFVVRAEMLYARDKVSLISSVRDSVKRGLGPEEEELPFLKPLPGNV